MNKDDIRTPLSEPCSAADLKQLESLGLTDIQSVCGRDAYGNVCFHMEAMFRKQKIMTCRYTIVDPAKVTEHTTFIFGAVAMVALVAEAVRKQNVEATAVRLPVSADKE